MIKYVLHPQWITSKNDGQRHFIGPKQLASLYRIPIAECIVAGDFLSEQENPIHLYPSYDGIYEIGAMNNPIKNIAREYTDFCISKYPFQMESDGGIQGRAEEFLDWLVKNDYIRLIEREAQ